MIAMMLNKFFTLFAISAVFMALPVNIAYAGQCEANYEMITKLHHPDPGSYTVWDAVYGEGKRDEVFASVVNHGDSVMAVGEVRSPKAVKPSIVFVKYDKRGRKVWDKYHAISGLRNIVKMLSYDDGVVVLINRRKSGGRGFLWLGFFDNEGSLKSQKIIKDGEHNLLATDIIPSIGDGNKKGWAISVTVERKYGGGKNALMRKNATVYLLDHNGNELSSRAYILGTNNEINGLSVSKFEDGKTGYIATGYFESPSGKEIGWLLRLSEDTSYAWQKEYGRGLSAKLKLSSGYRDRYILAFGDVMPLHSKTSGSWLMLVDGSNGKTLWQRYYYGETGRHDYTAKGVFVNKDGLITLMMMADIIDGNNISSDEDELDNINYAHVITLSPRGVTLSGDAYYNGQGVVVSQIIEGVDGSRVMVGHSFVTAKDIIKEKRLAKKHPSPLKEEGYVNLPDVNLSDKANEGLAMLNKKIKAQRVYKEQAESAKEDHSVSDLDDLTQNGWVLIGEMPEAYTDPCIITQRKLK